MKKLQKISAIILIGLTAIVSACRGPYKQNYSWYGKVPAAQEYNVGCAVYDASKEKCGSDTKIYDPLNKSAGMLIAIDCDGDYAPERIELFGIPKNDQKRELTSSNLTEIIAQAVAEAKLDYNKKVAQSK
ncbi:hypothetical protein JW756_02400 [Candidatus Woesearchaeota archaeon]|nr:hypothetical protein [Candidatus Woesearchaeota archaeon]